MVGDVYTIAGGKGGVGKSTTALNVSIALQQAGDDVVLVDADLGMSNLAEIVRIDHEPRLHQVLSGQAELGDAIADGPGDVSLLAGEGSLAAFAEADPANLRPVLKSLQRAYDAIIVDTGAGLTHETIVPVGLADGVVLVTTPDDVAVDDTLKTAQLVDRVDGDIAGVVITRAGPETNVSRIGDRLGMDVLAVVPDDPDALADPPLLLTAEGSYAAQAYRRLADKIQRHAAADEAERRANP